MSLNISNFFQYYMFHPEQAPKTEEKILSWVMSVALGILTAGIAHLICYAALYQKNIQEIQEPNPVQKKTDEIFKSILEKVQVQVPTASLPEYRPAIKSSSLSQETKSNFPPMIPPIPSALETLPTQPAGNTTEPARLHPSISDSSLTDSENTQTHTPRPSLKEHPVSLLNINDAIKAQTDSPASTSQPAPEQTRKKNSSPSNQTLPKSTSSKEKTPSSITSLKEPPVPRPRLKKNGNPPQTSKNLPSEDFSQGAKTHRPTSPQTTASSSSKHQRSNTLNRSLSWDTPPPPKPAQIAHNQTESESKTHKKPGLKLPSFRQLFSHHEKKEDKPVPQSKENAKDAAANTRPVRKKTRRWSYSAKPEDGVRKVHRNQLTETTAQKKN